MFARTISTAMAALWLALFAGCQGTKTEIPPQRASTPAPAQAAAAPQVHAQTNTVRLPPDSGDSMAQNILAWDAREKIYQVQPGDVFAPFSFSMTNVSPGRVLIYDTSTTCDCTVASLPSKPWAVPSGGAGEIHATIDLRRKHGSVTNQIIVLTSKGNRRLTVIAIAPEPAPTSSR